MVRVFAEHFAQQVRPCAGRRPPGSREATRRGPPSTCSASCVETTFWYLRLSARMAGSRCFSGQAEEPLGAPAACAGRRRSAGRPLRPCPSRGRSCTRSSRPRGIDQAQCVPLNSSPIGHFRSRASSRSKRACGLACQWRSSCGGDLVEVLPTGSVWMSIIQGCSASLGSTSLTAQVGRSVSLYSGRTTSSDCAAFSSCARSTGRSAPSRTPLSEAGKVADLGEHSSCSSRHRHAGTSDDPERCCD